MRATHVVNLENEYMQAHFPEFTVYPGVFLLETVLQALAAELERSDTVATSVIHIHSMRFVAPFCLGDTVALTAAVSPDEVGLHVDARFRHHDRDDGAEAARIRFSLPQVSVR